MEHPRLDPDSGLAGTLKILDAAVSAIFFIELLLKVVTYGFALNGENSYVKNPWNLLDLVIVTTFLASSTS